jgi:hypothetical protein
VLLLDTNLLSPDSATGVPGDVLLQQVLPFAVIRCCLLLLLQMQPQQLHSCHANEQFDTTSGTPYAVQASHLLYA